MTGAFDDANLQTLWQSQSRDANAISLDQIRQKSRRLERNVSRRNLVEYIAAVFVLVSFSWIMWVESSGTVRTGAGLVIAAVVFVVYQLHTRGTATSFPSDLGLRSALEFHRVQITRQVDLLRSIWWWYLLPMVPGFIVLNIGMALEHPERRLRIAATGVLGVLLALGIYELNRRAAAGLQRRLDRLKEDAP
jgi:hypothetical protein